MMLGYSSWTNPVASNAACPGLLALGVALWPGADSTHVLVGTAAAVHVPGDPASLSRVDEAEAAQTISVRVHHPMFGSYLASIWCKIRSL